jgi:hypothetical protein
VNLSTIPIGAQVRVERGVGDRPFWTVTGRVTWVGRYLGGTRLGFALDNGMLLPWIPDPVNGRTLWQRVEVVA